jgi:hypothetical protein
MLSCLASVRSLSSRIDGPFLRADTCGVMFDKRFVSAANGVSENDASGARWPRPTCRATIAILRG